MDNVFDNLYPIYDTSLSFAKSFLLSGYEVFVVFPEDVLWDQNVVFYASRLNIKDNISINSFSNELDHNIWPFELSKQKDRIQDFHKTDLFFIRQNPPINMEYINNLQILSQIEDKITFINSPRALLLHSEKLSILQFSDYIAPTIVTSNKDKIQQFLQTHSKIVIKPLHLCAGQGITKISSFEELKTFYFDKEESCNEIYMVQKFLDNVTYGDKRVIIAGYKYLTTINRIPKSGDFISNLCAGGNFEKTSLTEREEKIIFKICSFCKYNKIAFAGIDLIDEYLSEINITSPTGIVHANSIYLKNYTQEAMNAIIESVYV